MRKYLAFLCGHFHPLGFEEFYAALEAENVEYEILEEKEQIIIFTTKDDPIRSAQRCAFLHSVSELVAEGLIQEKEMEIKSLKNGIIIPNNSTFCVRVRKIGEKVVAIQSTEIERKLGKFILETFDNYNLKVKLKNPDYNFTAFLIKNKFYFGIEHWSVDRKQYHKREPSRRPFFRPGSMKTDYARALVNLSRFKSGDVFFDPFCGSGGILLEASMIGANCLGADIDYKAAFGTKKNLQKFGKEYYSVLISDSRFFPVKRVHAIATDPPYSIQSSTHGEKLSDLLQKFLEEAKKILLPGGYLAFSSPSHLQAEVIVEKIGFKIVSLIDTRIHKSLTRRILVVK